MRPAAGTRVMIIGGGFAGLYTALYVSQSALGKSRKSEIILLEPRERFLFTPLLYERLSNEIDWWEIAPTYERLLLGTGIQHRSLAVDAIDLAERRVIVGDGSRLPYDYLVLGVGRATALPPIPGLAEHAYSFRTFEDAERLTEKLKFLAAAERGSAVNIAIIGGGPSGVELACKISDCFPAKRVRIQLIEQSNWFLSGFNSPIRQAAQKALARRAVQIDCGTSLKEVQSKEIKLTVDGKEINRTVDLVIWAGGTQRQSCLASLDCEQNELGQLLTEATLQLPSDERVFALGDLAQIKGDNSTPNTAQAAYQAAACAAKNIEALIQGKSLKPFKYKHLGDMLTLGKGGAVLNSFGLTLTGQIASAARRFIYVFRLPTRFHRWEVLRHLLQRWGQDFVAGLSGRKSGRAQRRK
ncbi:MAG: NAD(P)/FAD-dependent oxidoreductase [Cyanobacteria bacterium P01_H01_bin.15]